MQDDVAGASSNIPEGFYGNLFSIFDGKSGDAVNSLKGAINGIPALGVDNGFPLTTLTSLDTVFNEDIAAL